MLSNVEAIENLRGLARIKGRIFTTKTVNPLLVEEHIADGWEIAGKTKRFVQLRRHKHHGVLLEDRVWSLLYRMEFTHLSDKGGGSLGLVSKDANGPKAQIDVLGIDSEVAIAIECKSS